MSSSAASAAPASAPAPRRSQRNVRSVYASHAKAPAEKPSARESAPPKSGKSSSSSSRPTSTAKARSSGEAATSTRAATPLKAKTKSKLDASAPEASASSAPTPTASSTPAASLSSSTAPSRPAKSKPAPRSGRASSAAHSSRQRLLLGRFTAQDAEALCEAVWTHVRANTTRTDVFERAMSPACIDWSAVARSLSDVGITSIECRALWHFMAYGASGSDAMETMRARGDGWLDESLVLSDIEAMEEGEGDEEARPTPVVKKTMTRDQAEGVDTQAERSKAAPLQLFPRYAMPRGVPDGWEEPVFKPREVVLPTTFVAVNFLKEKKKAEEATPAPAPVPSAMAASAPPLASATTAATQGSVSTSHGEKAAVAKPMEQPQGSPSPNATSPSQASPTQPTEADGAALTAPKASSSVEKKRPMKEAHAQCDVKMAGSSSSSAKRAKLAEESKAAPTTSTPSPLSAQTTLPQTTSIEVPESTVPTSSSTLSSTSTSSAVTPRKEYTPSSTPPPMALPPRSAFEFFCRIYEEDPQACGLKSTADAAMKDPPDATARAEAEETSNRSILRLKTLFDRAPASLRLACEKMAIDDRDRFNRECLRRRLWEKATGNPTQSSPRENSITTDAPAKSPSPSLAREN